MDLRLNWGVNEARNLGIIRPQDTVIIVTGSLAGPGNTNTMQVFKVSSLINFVSLSNEFWCLCSLGSILLNVVGAR